MNGSCLNDRPHAVAVDDFLEQLLPRAVAAVTDPDAVRRLGERELLTYTLQVLHASAWQDVDAEGMDFDDD
jgi:hypothetical protein